MKKALAIGFVLGALVAWASEVRVATLQGANIRCYTGQAGGHYSVQCPNMDGGAGQKVFYRPGCPLKADGGAFCQPDAGVGDVILDFTNNTDPYKIDLGVNEDRFCVADITAYTNPVLCNVYRRSPP